MTKVYKKRIKCVIQGCDNLNVSTKLSKDYCGKHYMRLLRGQKLTENSIFDKRIAIIEGNIAKIPLGVNAKDGYTIVDKEFSYLDKYKWWLTNDGYAATKKKPKGNGNIRLHHLILDKPVHPIVTDHINGDKLDNRKSNLRHASYGLNGHNRSKINSNTGYQGIHYSEISKGYRTTITKDKIRHQKFFKDLDKAVDYMKNKSKELYKENK